MSRRRPPPPRCISRKQIAIDNSPALVVFAVDCETDTFKLTAKIVGGGLDHSSGRRMDKRWRNPPNLALPLVDCAALVHPKMPGGRNDDQGRGWVFAPVA